jgi:3-deoxy-D-manno-octulosonate 8-phosphate phosphatase KdsC-like HAD superfamily phosphatase
MEYAVVTVNECKEVKSILELVGAIAVDVKAKKAAAEIAADVLPKLIVALEGVAALGDELKDENLYETVALGVVGLIKELKK